MNYLITGSGRCGTGFCANLLKSVDIACTHEGVFTLHGWEYACRQMAIQRRHPENGFVAEASWLAAPYLKYPELHAVTVVHLVREPVMVIESLVRMGFFHLKKYSPWATYAVNHMPFLEKLKTNVEKAAYLYVHLNWMVEERADIFHRIEDNPRLLLDKLGVDYHDKELFDDKKYNTRTDHCDYGEEQVDLNSLPFPLVDQLFRIGRKYGYQGSDHDAG